MEIRTLGTAAALSLLLAGAAFAADQPGHQSPAPGASNDIISAVKDATAGAVGAVSAEMPTTTKDFVQAAALSDMYEVEAGKLAARRGQTDGVRRFAREMVAAHTKTTRQLKTILTADNIAVTPPASLDDRRQGMMDDLRGAKAADFDNRYLAQQINAHREARTLMQGYANSGDNADIKQFAATTLPVVEHHLSMAEDLQSGKDDMSMMASK